MMFDPTQEAKIKRQRRMAEMLQAQAKPRQTEVVGGYAVPQSGFEGLAKGLAGFAGGYQSAQADTMEEDLAKQRQKVYADALAAGSREEAGAILAQDPKMLSESIKLKFPTSAMGGATSVIADRLIEQGVDPLEAILIAKSGLGTGRTMQDGVVKPMAGAPEAGGAIKYGEEAGKLGAQLALKPEITRATEAAKSGAERTSELNERMAVMPQLDATVDKLAELGDKATFSWVGRAIGEGARQLNAPRQSDIARTEYQSLIDNQILPLLRQTFGAQFTQKEGDSLKSTLGDLNKSPEEKKAVLRSFISQKQEQINTLQRQLGQPLTDFGGQQAADPLAAARDAIAKGAPRDAVIKRLQENGIATDGL